MSSSPIRKNDYPYLGCKILNGQTTEHDWIDIIETKNLPFVINPKKGYFVTANNRIVPDNSKYDIGATQISTARANRITEIITNKIKKGEKFDI